MDGITNRVALSQVIVDTIESLWPEMPGLFGDRWPGVEHKVESMLHRAYIELEISLGDQPDEWREPEIGLLYLLFDVFSTCPRASNRLTEVLEWFIGPIHHLKPTERPGAGSNQRSED